MRMILAGLALLVASALSGCVTDGMTVEEKAMFRDAAVAEVEYRIEQLQELELLNFEVEPAVLIAADAACSFISLASPYVVIALNNKTVEANLERSSDDQEELMTIEDFQANLHAVCKILRKLLKPKPADSPDPAPEVAPVPASSPVNGSSSMINLGS